LAIDLARTVIAENRLTKIKGIGAAVVDKITDAIITWRNANGYGSEDEDDEDTDSADE